MIRVSQLVLIVLASILIDGCNCEPYPRFELQKIDLSGAYIELGDKKMQKTCTPKLLELNVLHRGVEQFYEDQIDRYNRSTEDAKRIKE